MDHYSAFVMGEANRGKPLMVFDWKKAARLIKKENVQSAAAGLRSDWEYTGGEILKDGKPVPKEETYTFLASTWATPELNIDGQIIECFVMQEGTGWDSDTYWPEEALEILRGE